VAEGLGSTVSYYLPSFLKNKTPGQLFIEFFQDKNEEIRYLKFNSGSFNDVLNHTNLPSIDKPLFVYIHV